MNFYRQTILITLLTALTACLTGCDRLAIRKAQTLGRDRQIVCPSDVKHHCAIPSLFQDLANWTMAPADTKPLHFVSVLDRGEDALLVRIHLIRAARRSIAIQSYIWEDDQVGRMLFHELAAAARRGVKVQLLIDQFGTHIPAAKLARMATTHVNINIKLFRPIMENGSKSLWREFSALFTDSKTLNQRMHNKLMLIDDCIGIVGGRNITNHYFDFGRNYCYKDLDLLTIGPIARKMRISFEHYWSSPLAQPALALADVAQSALKWYRIKSHILPSKENFSSLAHLSFLADQYALTEGRPSLEIYPVSNIDFVADWPDKSQLAEHQNWDCTAHLTQMIANANREIVAQTPYLIQDWGSIFFLKQLRQNKPDLRIALSTNSLASTDQFYVYAVCFKQRQFYLEDLNARLFEFKPVPDDVMTILPRYGQLADKPFNLDQVIRGEVNPQKTGGPRLIIHSKFFVIDGQTAFVGSHNFDPRARNLNTECAVIIQDPALAQAVRKIFQRDTAPRNSWVVARRWKVPVIGQVSESIAGVSSSLPIFDLWPFEYSSNFALRDNCQPVDPDDPQFYQRYQDVGIFPQMELSPQWLAVRFIKAFGGMATGFM